jgi:hypothetical protein
VAVLGFLEVSLRLGESSQAQAKAVEGHREKRTAIINNKIPYIPPASENY